MSGWNNAPVALPSVPIQ